MIYFGSNELHLWFTLEVMIYHGNKKINQNPTPNPSTEGNQLDVSQPGNSRFSNFSHENTLYKQCNPKFGAPLLSRCVGNDGSPSSSLVITLLLLHRIAAPLVVIGRFHNLGITKERKIEKISDSSVGNEWATTWIYQRGKVIAQSSLSLFQRLRLCVLIIFPL